MAENANDEVVAAPRSTPPRRTAPSLTERRADIARIRGRMDDTLTALELRVSDSVQAILRADRPAGPPTGLSALVNGGLLLAASATRLKRALPLGRHVVFGVIAAGAVAFVLLGRGRQS